jgi:hypothetical protein
MRFPMSPFYESTAHLLLILTRCGLKVPTNVDCRVVLDRLILRFTYLYREGKGLTHSGAATWILNDLEKARLVTCEDEVRDRVLAILGTGIANVEHQSRASARK